MKTIVIAGARSGVGKTTLANELLAVLPGSVFVKIGHHPENPAKREALYPMGTTSRELYLRYGSAAYLIIESNGILQEITPDCAIYLDADNPKPSAFSAKEKADIISGRKTNPGKIKQMAGRLGIDLQAMRRIAWLAGARPSKATAIILAGGKSTRMGKDKAHLKVNGVSLVERLTDTLTPFFDHILISTAPDSPAWKGYRTVIDLFPGSGPLSGIYSCLSASETEHNFVIACDIPIVNIAVLHKLLSVSGDCDAAAPSLKNGFAEPLFAFYRKQVAQKARALLLAGEFRARCLLEECTTHILNVPETGWYANMNTPDDFQNFLSGRFPPSTQAEEMELRML